MLVPKHIGKDPDQCREWKVFEHNGQEAEVEVRPLTSIDLADLTNKASKKIAKKGIVDTVLDPRVYCKILANRAISDMRNFKRLDDAGEVVDYPYSPEMAVAFVSDWPKFKVWLESKCTDIAVEQEEGED